ncbi:MAG: acetylglutamate kinase [Selenomonadales bacterium]|jgi:acetylglutamate kinase|nr:acetylglutamate kinase [Selenomonadales bacterium]MBQ2114583.1 acetylglutamate kinase [Selenomonadales bacterium]MBQ2247089.1 acetylglutamate kinase [Selenomonadales bacterium]MBQ5586986.1 acetylglutamate kinase [Selenomonadales bacterium]MBQ5637082.1 acetylglutamate kinase [Selenomonadales bacterium]
MSFSAGQKASVLIEALPYIKRFYGKTMVIKYGGNAMINEELKAKVIEDICLMKYVGMRPVIVHGGGPEITGFLKKIGKQTEFIAGLRVTDEETVGVAEMVLVGKINSEIVSLLNNYGAKAVGLSGKDASLICAEKHLAEVYEDEQAEPKLVDIGYVGDVAKINTDILNTLLDQGYTPVIAPIGVGENNESYNINADYVAGEVAGALQAEKLILLTDIEGIYRDYNDKDSLIETLTREDAMAMIREGTIAGGMIPKVESCIRAIDGGAQKTHIIDGRLPHALILEVFTKRGIGTEVIGDEGAEA